jgi:hypothetical protein
MAIKGNKYYNVTYGFVRCLNFVGKIACKQGEQQTNHPRQRSLQHHQTLRDRSLPKLSRAGRVSTIFLLGHKPNHNTSTFIPSHLHTLLRKYDTSVKVLSEFLCVSPPPSFRRSEPSANVGQHEHHPILVDTNAGIG